MKDAIQLENFMLDLRLLKQMRNVTVCPLTSGFFGDIFLLVLSCVCLKLLTEILPEITRKMTPNYRFEGANGNVLHTV
jgi:hypothetical protein